MNITLTWTPGAGATSQDVQYKLSTSGTWITHATVGAAITTSTISGLSDNLIYDFRVVTVCAGGNTPSTGTQQINIICPTVTVTKTHNTASYSFTHIGGSITGYTVQLLNAAGTTVLQTQAPSITSPVSGTFTGLTAVTSYNIRVTVIAGTFSKECSLNAFTTDSTPVCNAPTGVTATLEPEV